MYRWRRHDRKSGSLDATATAVMATRVVVRRTLLEERPHACACGHTFEMWTEDLADGTWELHFAAPCAETEAIADMIIARIPGRGRRMGR